MARHTQHTTAGCQDGGSSARVSGPWSLTGVPIIDRLNSVTARCTAGPGVWQDAMPGRRGEAHMPAHRTAQARRVARARGGDEPWARLAALAALLIVVMGVFAGLMAAPAPAVAFAHSLPAQIAISGGGRPAVTATAAASGNQTAVPAPSDLASNGLTIFATLGCIIGLIGLLALTIAWITLMSDGWGPMLKAVALGNRRGRRRFKRAGVDSGRRGREGVRSVARSRGGW